MTLQNFPGLERGNIFCDDPGHYLKNNFTIGMGVSKNIQNTIRNPFLISFSVYLENCLPICYLWKTSKCPLLNTESHFQCDIFHLFFQDILIIAVYVIGS